jgi:hypothetical protein
MLKNVLGIFRAKENVQLFRLAGGLIEGIDETELL